MSRGTDAVLVVVGGERVSLARCSDSELDLLIRLMVAPLVDGENVNAEGVDLDELEGEFLMWDDVAVRVQNGFLQTVQDVLRALGTRVVKRWGVLIRAVVAVGERSLSVQPRWATMRSKMRMKTRRVKQTLLKTYRPAMSAPRVPSVLNHSS